MILFRKKNVLFNFLKFSLVTFKQLYTEPYSFVIYQLTPKVRNCVSLVQFFNTATTNRNQELKKDTQQKHFTKYCDCKYIVTSCSASID